MQIPTALLKWMLDVLVPILLTVWTIVAIAVIVRSWRKQ